MKNHRDIERLHAVIRSRKVIAFGVLSALLFITIIAAISIGPVPIPFTTVMGILFHLPGNWPAKYETIVLDIRLPRVLLGALVGSALASAGCAMQGLFRNPMASSYVLGISSGAAFGASLAMVVGLSASALLPISLSAFVFAMMTILIVYLVARVDGEVPVYSLLLAGIAIGTFFNALVSLMKYVAGDELRSIVYWLMGGLWASTWTKVLIAFPPIFLGIFFLMLYGRDLNIMLMGEEHAIGLGVETETVKRVVLVFSSLITAVAVAMSGIIGFVGLVIPHIMRLIVGPDHRSLLPASAMAGAIFLIATDAIARTIISPAEVPVGIITACIGAPFFLYLLRRRHRTWAF